MALSSRQFTWDKQSLLGVADLTDLYGKKSPPVEFTVKSTKTGKNKTFEFYKLRKNNEGEAVALVYRSKGPRPVTVELIND